MKIARIAAWQVPLSSHANDYIPEGKSCATVTTTLVALETDSGLTGWGENCPVPGHLPAYAGGVVPAMAELAESLLEDLEIRRPERGAGRPRPLSTSRCADMHGMRLGLRRDHRGRAPPRRRDRSGAGAQRLRPVRLRRPAP